MAEAASYEWRITIIPTGEILQTERTYTSPEEALSAAKEHAIRAIESDFDLHVAVLDNEEKVVSELSSVTSGDLAKSAKASKNRRRSRQSPAEPRQSVYQGRQPRRRNSGNRK